MDVDRVESELKNLNQQEKLKLVTLLDLHLTYEPKKAAIFLDRQKPL